MSSENKKRRVVVTGLGLVSPIGIGREPFWEHLGSGQSGVCQTESYHCTATPGGIGAEVKDFTESTAKKQYLKSQRKSIKVMCREIQMGAAAAMQALEDSALDLATLDHERMGVEFGANLMFFDPQSMADSCVQCVDESGEFQMSRWGEAGLGSMEPLWMLRYLPNMPACHIAIFTDARGPNNSITLDEASPGVALTEALNILERGAADMMIVGGTGTRIHPVRAIHARMWDELGYDETNPSASCKPFDSRRNGLVVGEGAACLILEEETHARSRGATIFGTLIGGGTSCVASPDGTANIGQALINAGHAALRRAGLSVEALGHVNAHGLGTHEDDRIEAIALRELLGGTDVPVTGLKGYFGNAGASTGFMEVAATLLSLKQGTIPQTLNCTDPDPQLELNVVSGEPRATSNKLFMKVNFTRAGQASAVIFEGA
jgi:3-oxoacyl-[acyl-carrier-protein] synthase II